MSEGAGFTHLTVQDGPDVGKRIRIPPGGARLGRADGNDLVLNDPSISRFQCRFYFKEGGYLAVADLGSTNETLVNNLPVQDVRLSVGDRVEVGQTLLVVTCDESAPVPASAPDPGLGGRAPEIDLGLHPETLSSVLRSAAPRPGFRWVLVAAAALLLVGGAWGLHRWLGRGAVVPLPAGEASSGRRLRIDYEKVEANASTIFRYHLRLQDNTLEVQIDTLADDRHVHREERVSPDMVDELARFIDESGFFELSSDYTGIAPDVWDQFDLEIGTDRRSHRVRVLNRVEPDRFREVRGTIEEFARNQIGLYALALPPERLVELARDAWLQGQKLFDAREVRFENLARAIRAFGEAETLLETIEPKPSFYADAIASREECRRLLQERYETYMFQAERAVRLRDWASADDNLRIVLDLLQDRSDERYESAYRQLLDVQRRLERQRR